MAPKMSSRIRIRYAAAHITTLISMCYLASGAVAGPRIHISEPVFDFGYTPAGLEAMHRYWVVNSGTDTLVINRVKSTCGCTTVPLPTDRVAPGDSVPLDLVFDTQKFTGKVHKSARIVSNEDPWEDTTGKGDRRIFFTAMVGAGDEAVTVSPASVYLDTIGKSTQVFSVTNKDTASYSVSLSSAPPHFMSVEIPAPQVPSQGQLEIVLRAGKDTPIGIYTGSMTLLFQGPRVFSITVPIYGVGYYQ